MIYVFAIIAIGLLMAMYFGPSDAQAIDQGTPINHDRNGWIVVIVAGCALLVLLCVAALSGASMQWCLTWPAILFGAFTPADRLLLNYSRCAPEVPLTYMGPSIRGPKESWYDGLWWGITRRIVRDYVVKGDIHIVYTRKSLISPFMAATAFELTVLAVSCTLYIINT